jgi:hypothetical protein
MQFAITEAGITVSGVSETVLASDVIDALKQMLRPDNYISGLGLNAAAPTQEFLSIAVGETRTQDNDKNLVLASAFTKDLSAVWAAGTGNGGVPAGVTFTNLDWVGVYLVRDNAGLMDITIDDVAGAATFFASAPASFDDTTLFKRIGWVQGDVIVGDIRPFFSTASNPRENRWSDFQVVLDANVAPTNGVRHLMDFIQNGAPPNSQVIANLSVEFTSDDNDILITTSQQTDFDPASRSTIHVATVTTTDNAAVLGAWDVGPSQQLYVRSTSAAGIANWDVQGIGWIDLALVDQ